MRLFLHKPLVSNSTALYGQENAGKRYSENLSLANYPLCRAIILLRMLSLKAKATGS